MSEKKQKDPFRMKIIISPAKKMNVDTDSFDCRDLPLFPCLYPAAFVLPSDYVLGSAARFMEMQRTAGPPKL